MRPNDPTAVSQRFASVVARSLERADREAAAALALLRAIPSVDEPLEDDGDPWEAPVEAPEHRRPLNATSRRPGVGSKDIAAPVRARHRRGARSALTSR